MSAPVRMQCTLTEWSDRIMATHSRAEAEKIREEILSRVDPNRPYDHVRIVPVDGGGDPAGSVKVLARRADNHVVEDEV